MNGTDRDRYPKWLGTVLLVIGLILVLVAFISAMTMVNNTGEYIRKQAPTQEAYKKPVSSFSWSSSGMTVTFTDISERGTLPITSYQWSFGDGGTSTEANPAHTYTQEGGYEVRLTIRDSNGTASTSRANIEVHPGSQLNGKSSLEGGDRTGDFIDPSAIIMPIAVVLFASLLYFVMVIAGAMIMKAGWNMVRPRPEYFQFRIKPKDIVAEPIQPKAPEPNFVTVAIPPPAHPPNTASSPQPLPHTQPLQVQ